MREQNNSKPSNLHISYIDDDTLGSRTRGADGRPTGEMLDLLDAATDGVVSRVDRLGGR